MSDSNVEFFGVSCLVVYFIDEWTATDVRSGRGAKCLICKGKCPAELGKGRPVMTGIPSSKPLI